MDFGGSTGDHHEMWNWRGAEYGLHQDSSLGELLHMLDEQTPIKDCALEDLDHQVSGFCDKNNNEEMMESLESSQQKRRRMLQFTLESDEVMDSELMDEGLSEHLEWNEQWNFNFSAEGNCALNSEGLDQLSEEWLDECLVQGETNNVEEMNMPMDSCDNSCASEIYSDQYETKPQMVQLNPNPRTKVTKGKKFLVKAPAKLTSSIAYPFALIKPCGGLTLNEINQKIHAPPKSKLKHKVEEQWGPLATSAYTGKQVVVRTKIRTEGGKGSITIMRTRG